ncbi:MAG: hypothetical protein ABSE21_01445 [Bryobacteraceae bacterium]
MIETYFTAPRVLDRMRSGPMAPCPGGFRGCCIALAKSELVRLLHIWRRVADNWGMNMKAKKITVKPKQYRVYLAWGKSSDDLLDGMECLLQPTHVKEDQFDLVNNEEVFVTAVSKSVEFV